MIESWLRYPKMRGIASEVKLHVRPPDKSGIYGPSGVAHRDSWDAVMH